MLCTIDHILYYGTIYCTCTIYNRLYAILYYILHTINIGSKSLRPVARFGKRRLRV